MDKIPQNGGMVREQQPPDYPRDDEGGFTPPMVRGADHAGKVDSHNLNVADKGRMMGQGSTRDKGDSA